MLVPTLHKHTHHSAAVVRELNDVREKDKECGHLKRKSLIDPEYLHLFGFSPGLAAVAVTWTIIITSLDCDFAQA